MKKVLPIIVISQFFCTSLWFAGNAVIHDIASQLHTGPSYPAHLASIVQLGFITGTLVFAIFNIADRLSPTKVFFTCAIIAAAVNLSICINDINASSVLLFRFITGFFLAGIYPVGMKIAADHYQKGLGRSLGFLVGALVLGTAFPHLLKGIGTTLPWQYVIYATSILALIGGLAILLWVPDGPYRQPANKFNATAFLNGFKKSSFRAAALGYFGHMWELYTFWVFVPIILTTYQMHNPHMSFNIPLLSSFIIGAGFLSCIFSGIISQRYGVKKVATIALSISCCCCIISPLIFYSATPLLFMIFMFLWSTSVIADSPLFSTLVAQTSPAALKGSSLTIVNALGFSTTILSLQCLNALKTTENARYIYVLLAIGPVMGLIALFTSKTKS